MSHDHYYDILISFYHFTPHQRTVRMRQRPRKQKSATHSNLPLKCYAVFSPAACCVWSSKLYFNISQTLFHISRFLVIISYSHGFNCDITIFVYPFTWHHRIVLVLQRTRSKLPAKCLICFVVLNFALQLLIHTRLHIMPSRFVLRQRNWRQRQAGLSTLGLFILCGSQFAVMSSIPGCIKTWFSETLF